MQSITCESSHQFYVNRLRVAAELVGAIHEFTHENRHVSIRIPSLVCFLDNKMENRQTIECDSWRIVDGQAVPISYSVACALIRIKVPEAHSVPDSALTQSPNRHELFPKADQDRMESILRDSDQFAKNALDYWLQILRWKTRIGYIGEPTFMANPRALGPTLVEPKTGRSFWNASHVLVLPPEHTISLDEWCSSQDALAQGARPPVWFPFIDECEFRIRCGDFVGAILNLAIGLEAAVRALLSNQIAPPVEQLVVSVLDRSNFRFILNNASALGCWPVKPTKQEYDKDAFNKLMNLRDEIMHSGKLAGVDAQALLDMHSKVKTLGYRVEELLQPGFPR